MIPMGAPVSPGAAPNPNAGLTALTPQQFNPGVAQAGGPLPAPITPPMPGAGPLPSAAMLGEMDGQFPAAQAIQMATQRPEQPDTRGSTPGLNSGFAKPFSAERQAQESRTTGGRSPLTVHDSAGNGVNAGTMGQMIRAAGARMGAGRV